MRMYSFAGLSLRVAPIRICNMLTVICLMSLAVLSSCIHADDSRLISAYASVDRNPDSVRRVLESIDPSTLAGDRNKALHSLYLTIARDKCQMLFGDTLLSASTDSLMTDALRTLDNILTREDAMLATYYKGLTMMSKQDYKGSMSYLLNAKRRAEKLGDTYHLAKILETTADVYLCTYDVAACIDLSRGLPDLYRMSGDTVKALYAEHGLASAYNDEEIPDSALAILSRVEYVLSGQDSVLYGMHYNIRARAYSLKGRYKESLEYYSKVWRAFINSELRDLIDYEDLFFAYINAGYVDSALNISDIALSAMELEGKEFQKHYILQEVAYRKGDYKKAYEEGKKAFSVHNDNIKGILHRNAALAERDFHEMNERISKEREKQLLWIIFVILLAIVLMLFILYHFMRIRKEEKSRHNERISSLLLQMKQHAEQIKGIRTGSSEQWSLIDSLVRNRISSVSNICREYENAADNKEKQELILRRFAGMIVDEQYEHELTKIISIVDISMNGIIDSLQKEVPGMSQKEITLYALLKTGMSVETILLVMGISGDNYYKMRSRIRKKIKDSGSSREEDFLSILK